MEKNQNKEQSKENKNTYLKYSGMAVQMGITIGLGAWGGMKLDQYFNLDSKVFTVVLSLLAVATSMYILIRNVIKDQE